MNIVKPFQLILGSGSPRRSQILKEADIDFIQKVRPIDEVYPENITKEEVPEYLANLKAEAFSKLDNDKIVLTADSIVILNDEILGKPTSLNDAVTKLQKLSGQNHIVITGVCLKHQTKTMSFSDTSYVEFANISKDEIDFYVNKYRPLDKAGAYGIQEWLGHCKIKSIKGSYLNIMGLPMHLVYENLNIMVQEIIFQR